MREGPHAIGNAVEWPAGIVAMFWFGRSAQEKLEFYNQGLTSGARRKLAVTLLFLVSFTHKSRTDSEPVPANRSNLKVNSSNCFPNRARVSQESPSTTPPDSHEEIGIHAAPILAARRAPHPIMSRPFRPSPAVTRRPVPQISLVDA